MNEQQCCELAAQELTAQLVHDFGDQLYAVVVYGSVARGQARAESDIDLLLVLPPEPTLRARASRVRYQVDLKYETLTTLLYRTQQQLSEALQAGSEFVRTILLTERVAFYHDGTFRRLRAQALAASAGIPQ